jgi:hypothetical protein
MHNMQLIVLVILYGNLCDLHNIIIKYMTTITYPNSKFVFTDENGNTGTTILPESITTPSITVSSIADSNGSTGASGYVLSSTGDGFKWITPFVGVAPTGTNLNMNNNNITNVNTITTTELSSNTITSNTIIDNQVSFTNNLPFSIYPTNSNNLATKEYADTLLSSTSKINKVTLFFNTSNKHYLYPTANNYLASLEKINTDASLNIVTSFTSSVGITANFYSLPLGVTTLPICVFKFKLYVGLLNSQSNVRVGAGIVLRNESKTSILTLATGSGTSTIYGSTTFPQEYVLYIVVKSPIVILPSYFLEFSFTVYTPTAPSNSITIYTEDKFYSHVDMMSNSDLSNMFLSSPDKDLNMSGYNITSNETININIPNTNTLSLAPTSNINIGGGNTTQLNLATLNNINIASPLIPNNIIAFNAVGMIGHIIEFTTTATSFTSSGSIISSTLLVPYAGVWGVSCCVAINTITSGTITNNYVYIQNTTTTSIVGIARNVINTTSNVGIGNILNFSGTLITTTTSNIIILNQQLSYSSGSYATTPTNFILKIIRIA